MGLTPNSSIERPSSSSLRLLAAAAHVEGSATPVRPVVRAYSFALLGLLASVDSLAADASFRGAALRLAPNTSSVTSCSDPNRSGQYRIVVFNQGFEHVSSEVYLQWLEWNQDGSRLLESVLVTELSSGLWSVGEPVVISQKNCSMQLAATHTYSSKAARFVLQPAGRGRYSIRRVGKR
jgi:hypothetical protein